MNFIRVFVCNYFRTCIPQNGLMFKSWHFAVENWLMLAFLLFIVIYVCFCFLFEILAYEIVCDDNFSFDFIVIVGIYRIEKHWAFNSVYLSFTVNRCTVRFILRFLFQWKPLHDWFLWWLLWIQRAQKSN